MLRQPEALVSENENLSGYKSSSNTLLALSSNAFSAFFILFSDFATAVRILA